MGHNIDYRSYPEAVSRVEVKNELDHYVSMEDWQEGCSGLYNPIRWIETVICDDCEKARAYIEKIDRGDYDNVAVRYFNCLPYSDAKIEELERKRNDARTKYMAKCNVIYPKTIKAAYITCKTCGSKLSRVHLRSNVCPLCKASICPESFDKDIKSAENRYNKARDNLERYRQSKAHKEVCWLVKFEYHT